MIQTKDTAATWRLAEGLAKADVIAEKARGLADQIDRERRVPDEIISGLKAAGLMRVRQPKAFGGHGACALDNFEIIYALSQACSSTGWVYCVLTGHAAQIADFPLQAQQEVWGDTPEALSSSSYAPTGKAVPVEGGYRLTGRYSFSSGCDHAQWAIVGSMVQPVGEPAPIMLLFLVPMRELTIVDDWFTLGLCGTGSKTLVAEDVFVPTYRARPPGMFVGGVPPFALATVMAGIARGAVDQFVADMRAAPASRNGRPADSELVQYAVALASGEADAAWLLIKRAVSESQGYNNDGSNLPLALKARNRSDNATVTQLSERAVDRLLSVAGGRTAYTGHPLQRRFRDIHTAARHVALAEGAAGRDAGLMMLNPEKPWP